ncbi:MAG: hypothetical protein U0904_11780 [Candidatus Nanopelagicales bacterium]|nr:hypothetical protein [Candidatus Nanopelagicales bacterium]
MKSRSVVLAVTVGGLVFSLLQLPAQAESSISLRTLAGTVVHRTDVLPWFPKAKTARAPGPATGADRSPRKLICGKSPSRLLSLKLPWRQATSAINAGLRRPEGISSLVAEYHSRTKARRALRAIKAKLAACPGLIESEGFTITQTNTRLGSVHGSEGIGMAMAMAAPTGWDDGEAAQNLLFYTVVRRTGRALAFTEFFRQKDWPSGPPAVPPAKTRRMVNRLSIVVASRYAAFS